MQAPVSRENSAVRGYDVLKRDIIRGLFKPGEKLLMSGLKERYGLGVGPLREALSQLVAERLVVAISQRGYRVAAMSLQELADIYDARAHLEAMLLTLAIERGDDSWEAEILARDYALAKVVEVRNAEEMLSLWDARHKAFHEAIVAGCGSHHLLKVRASLFDQAERYRHLWLQHTVFSDQALQAKRQEHAVLVEAILARDAVRASRIMREHLLGPVPIITALMRQRGLAG
ncbi:HTH-type transcriptional repressor CsiR [Pseudomonas oleovorans subsp. oleovorans]|jgi:GntR family carbon starvation induced transcriptional regulator|uniref:Putative GntR family transcriptional regulator n=1 Tax=Ectopseudomonas oleovorans TaxID=301 RepID=A0A379JQK6_ECTOL|nr:DNA-binding transcriptional regulator CsiR [Pseudomonas oleovorans]OWK44217.1 HTH-type transcriptional repressor CsiR [Pseudomonas oleovorans subsp. oleovorans]SEJ11993.1 transcriptional regulator, GntR family [Pseudomonas oleovorans]SUD50720.1 putative GntR family transcriptional regulator [Pseudomonas oleovorans]